MPKQLAYPGGTSRHPFILKTGVKDCSGVDHWWEVAAWTSVVVEVCGMKNLNSPLFCSPPNKINPSLLPGMSEVRTWRWWRCVA